MAKKQKRELPTWKEAKRAVVYRRTKSGRPKLYRDPISNSVWTAYQIRLARSGYLTPRQVTAARKTIGAGRYNELTRTVEEGGIAPLAFVNHAVQAANYARKQGMTVEEAIRSEGYWNAVESVLIPLQVSKRIGMAAHRWSIESAYDTVEEAWQDIDFYRYVMATDKKGNRKRFADIPEWLVAEIFDNYESLVIDFYNAFGDTWQDWETSGEG